MQKASTRPRATARLQLHKGFTLDDAASVVPYLADLGISHVYTSPLLRARPGSMHGYDIVDHNSINPELGGEPALRRMVRVIREHGMGLIVDIVPNHMGVGGADNAWWLDVLEWGRASPYATFFDIDWAPSDTTLLNRIQMPFLGASYGDCMENAEIRLVFEPETGRLAAQYAEHVFPISPPDYRHVFGGLVGEFTQELSQISSRATARVAAAAMKAHLSAHAQSPAGADEIAAAVARYDAAAPDGRARLHAFLERQNFRLVWWRAATDEINWRRFFDVTSLAGVRAEIPAVFDATHALISRLYAEGLIDGVRVDHVDGLADPRGYCRKLRRRLETAALTRPEDAPEGAPYIVVEKILAPRERLAQDWLTDGTTGYDFMDQVSALLHDPDGEAPLETLWREMSGRADSYETEEREARRLILRDALASELNATAAAFLRIARSALSTRDYTLTAIRRALVEVLVHFPVYRLYAGLAGRHRQDDQVLAWAMAGAKRTMRAADHPLLDQIGLWLGGEPARTLPPGARRRERLRAIVRFGQLSSPVAAKSMEDTAFYRYGRLLSRNEVGSNPGQFARSIAAFHAACAERGKKFPDAMLATATHDHKRGEDLRARLAVLSEIPDEWTAQLQRWIRLDAPLRREFANSPAPDAADEIMLYQMLVAAWPPLLHAGDHNGIKDFAERIVQWQLKALREAKRHTAWVAPDEAYETACREFVFQVLEPGRAADVAQEIAAFAARLGPAGASNGLAQTMLRMTVPGVPDLYQGTDRWDFSLVDPDNRRPVDYDERRAFLSGTYRADGAIDIGDWRDGTVKQSIIARTLAFRAAHAELFAKGRYLPLEVTGPAAEHVVAFARQNGEAKVIVAVTRRPAALLGAHTDLVAPDERWNGTTIAPLRSWVGRGTTNVLTGATGRMTAGFPVATLLRDLPVALMQVA